MTPNNPTQVTDLDARVAALMAHADAFAYDKTLAGTCINRVNLEIAIRAELQKPAQEEIKDAERYQFAAKHCVLSGGGRFGWSIAPATKAEWDRYLDAAIHASKGEKT